MTNDEAKEAFKNKTPVYWNGVLYTKISAIIYRYDPYGNLLVSAAESMTKTAYGSRISRGSEWDTYSRS